MVWFLAVTRLIGEGKQRGRGVGCLFILTCLPYQILLTIEKIHLAQGAVKMRKEK